MRIWERLKPIVPMLMALLPVAESSAQQMAPFQSAGAPAFMAGQGGYMPQYQGMPQSFQSNPMISPFDHALEETFQTDGIWFQRFLSSMGPRNDFNFKVEFISTKTRGQKGRIGHHNAPSAVQEGADDLGVIDIGLPDAGFFEPFPVHYASEVAAIKNSGIRLSGGMENRQGWGFKWWAGYNGDANKRRDFDDERLESQLHFSDAVFLDESGGVSDGPLPSNLRVYDERDIVENTILGRRIFDVTDTQLHGISGSTFDILDRHIYPYASVPIQTGPAALDADQLDTSPYGLPLFYDVYFDIETNIETYGTGAHFAFAPIYESDSCQIRPVMGGRYYQINESFRWRGGSSGLGYGFSQPDGIDDDDDFWVDNVDENGNTNFTPLIGDGIQEILVRSFMQSSVRSRLAGPEIGFEFNLGEKKGVELNGHTKVGLMVNKENARLSGDNIGAQFDTELDLTTLAIVRRQLFDTSTSGVGRSQNFFESSNNTTHISPMFEQQLNAEIPIFASLPVLRDVWQLENAKLTLGWNFLFLGEVADPSESIDYTARPTQGIFPQIQIQRGTFYQNTLSAGINWDF